MTDLPTLQENRFTGTRRKRRMYRFVSKSLFCNCFSQGYSFISRTRASGSKDVILSLLARFDVIKDISIVCGGGIYVSSSRGMSLAWHMHIYMVFKLRSFLRWVQVDTLAKMLVWTSLQFWQASLFRFRSFEEVQEEQTHDRVTGRIFRLFREERNAGWLYGLEYAALTYGKRGAEPGKGDTKGPIGRL